MADKETNPELDELAFTIFSQRVAHSGRASEYEAAQCFKAAKCFQAARAKARRGELELKAEGQQADYASCPNQKRTHPHNLISQAKGDLGKVNRIAEWLKINPMPETDPQNLVDRLNQQFPDLDWDLPTLTANRSLLTAYAKN